MGSVQAATGVSSLTILRRQYIAMEDDLSPNAADLPDALTRLLQAEAGSAQDAAWEAFLASYHKLVLHAIRSTIRDHDVVMDCYAYVLEHLRAEDYRRLRAFAAHGSAKFSTWLVVVAHRLVLDHRRRRYGRASSGENETASRQFEARKRLTDLVADALDVDTLPDESLPDPTRELSVAERHGALRNVVSGLGGRDQLLLSLRFQENRSAREIAEILGFPSPFHVYRRLKAVLAQVRAGLESRGIDGVDP